MMLLLVGLGNPNPNNSNNRHNVGFTIIDAMHSVTIGDNVKIGWNCTIMSNSTIDGKKARLTIPSGTQSETQFRLRGKGMSILRQSRRGDMYVETNVEIPVNLNSKQKSILKEFEKEGGTSKKHSPKSQSFFSKLKEVWEDLT